MGITTPKARPQSRAFLAGKPLITGAARPKYRLDGDVMQAARGRIRWLFDEFDGNVSVSNSGGKDSTVVLELAAEVARERGERLHVTWLDQECEYQATVDYQRYIRDRPDIDFHWYQVPFRLFNATNHDEPWLHVWGEGEEWVRPKEPAELPGSHHVNTFGTDRFKEVLSRINMQRGGAVLTGMRCEESPARRLVMTSAPMYKWATWCSADGDPAEPYYRFHPIYDWSYRDVWKAIYTEGWRYNTFYDVQFRHGVPVKNMRVSNYHHETALGSLLYLQEAEPETWEAATRRLQGINTYGHIGRDSVPKSLPYMFASWEEYMGHLIDHLCQRLEDRETFRKMHARVLKAVPDQERERVAQIITGAVIGNDLYGTTVDMWMVNVRGRAKIAAARAEQDEAFVGKDVAA